MSNTINISIQKKDAKYLGFCSEIPNREFQAESLDIIFDEIKQAIKQSAVDTDEQPIWEIAQTLTQDMTEEELNQLPTDGAQYHDRYIYG